MPHPSGRPWVVAHRGASHARPENTIEAFRHAAVLGADAVELDVRRTADGALVVIHDAHIAGRPVVEMSRHEIAAAAPHVPDLDDAIAACDDMWVDVEVKNNPAEPDWDPDANVALRVASALSGRDDIVISSFDPASVAAAVAGGVRSGLLVGHHTDPVSALGTIPGIEFLLPPISAMRADDAAEIVSAAGAAGIEVGVWWTDDPGEVRRLAAAGVGIVFTNSPDVARAALG